MINELTLRNFQRHKRRRIKLPRVLTITGLNDVGKTSLLRALMLVATNQPAGMDYITHGAEQCSVTVRVGKHTIKRVRSKQRNSYSLNGRVLKSFKTHVPEPVQKILNMDGINFQGPFDAPFWLSASPGQVAKEINRIINLDVIDDTLRRTALKISQTTTIKKYIQGEIKTHKEQLHKTRWIPRAVKELEKLHVLYHELVAQRVYNDLMDNQLRQCLKAQTVNDLAVGASVGVAKLVQLGTDVVAMGQRLDQLDQLLKRLDKQRVAECQTQKKIGEVSADLRRLTKGKCPICGRPIKEIR